MSTRSSWTLAIVSIALFMVTLDNLVVTNALVSIREDLGASLEELEWTVNAYTLSFAVFLLDWRRAGGPARPPVGLRGRPRRVHLGLGGRRAGAEHRCPHRVARGAGARRGDHHAAVAHPPERGLQRRQARAGPRDLVRGLRAGRRARPGRWRRRGRGLLLAVDLLAQRPGGPRAGSRGADPPPREPRAGGHARRTWCGARERRAARGGIRDRPGPVAGLDEHDGAAVDRRRRDPARRVRGLGAAHEGPDAPHALLPQPQLLGHERGVAGDVLRRLRLDLPAGPVLPGGAGLFAAGGGHPDAALDGHADLRGPGGGHPVGPHRQPAADGGGPGAAGGGAGLARGRHHAGRRPTDC